MTAAYGGKSDKGTKSEKEPGAPAKAPSNGSSKGGRPGSSPSPGAPGNGYYSGKSGKSGGSSGGKSGKSRVVTTGICNKRLMIAFEEIMALGPDGQFGTISDPSDVTELCAFSPPEEGSDDFNFGCPFIYLPEEGFLQGDDQYINLFGEEPGIAFNSLVLYCQCHHGFDMGCAAKIPHGPPTSTVEYEEKSVTVNGYSEFIPFSDPGTRADYCKLAGVWNGDFGEDITAELDSDVLDCGCFWVGTAKEMVDTCPGVELGAFFEYPVGPSDYPTYAPSPSTYSPYTFPPSTFPPTSDFGEFTFYESFESGTFPDANWTSDGDGLWVISDKEADEGTSSLKAPDFSANDAQRIAYVNLNVKESWGTPGVVVFKVFTPEIADDYLLLFVDDKEVKFDIYSFGGWRTFEQPIGPGDHTVSWVYIYNLFEETSPENGEVFIDSVRFYPNE